MNVLSLVKAKAQVMADKDLAMPLPPALLVLGMLAGPSSVSAAL